MTRLFLYKSLHEMFAVNSKIMFKTLVGLIVFCVLACGCSKKQAEIQTEPPQAITDLIKDIETNQPDCVCHPYISQYMWRNENVYVLANDDALNIGYICDWIPVFYDSNGQRFSLETGYNYEKFLSDSRLVQNVWICH